MSFLVSNPQSDLFFKKEEEPAPPKEPAKPPSIFGGLSVKTTPVPVKPKSNILQPATTKYVERPSDPKPSHDYSRKPYKDPFDDIPAEPLKLDPRPIEKKNDSSSIEFLLDLTMTELPASKPEARKRPEGPLNPSKPQEPAIRKPEPGITEKTTNKNDEVHPKAHEAIQSQPHFDISINEPEKAKIDTAFAESKPREMLSQPIEVKSDKEIKENKFKKQLEEKRRRELEEKEKAEVARMQKLIEEQKVKEQLANPVELREVLARKIGENKEIIAQIISEQATIQEIQNKIEATLVELHEKCVETEELAGMAAEGEDFELAAKYSDELEGLKLQITFTRKELNKKSENYLQFELKKSDVYERLEDLIEDYSEKIENLNRSLKSELDSFTAELESVEKAKIAYNSSVTSEVDQKNLEIAEISQSVEERKSELSTKIKARTAPLQELKQETITKVEKIEQEIEELTRLLREKTESLHEVQESLNRINAEIEESTVEFSEEVNDCEIAESLLKSEQQLRDDMLAAQEIKEKQFSKEIMQKREEIEENSKKIASFEEILGFVRQEAEAIKEVKAKRQAAIEGISKVTASLKEKNELLKESDEYLQGFTIEITALSEKTCIHEERLKLITAKLPVLEAEKKSAALSKQFKEAAKLANELKEIASETSTLTQTLEQLALTLKEKQEEHKMVISIKIQSNQNEIKQEIRDLQSQLESYKQTLITLDNSN